MRISDWSSDVCSSDLWQMASSRRSAALTTACAHCTNSLRGYGLPRLVMAPSRRFSPLECSDGVMPMLAANCRASAKRATLWPYSPTKAVAVRSEEHTSELQSLMRNSYAVFCLKKTNKHIWHQQHITN